MKSKQQSYNDLNIRIIKACLKDIKTHHIKNNLKINVSNLTNLSCVKLCKLSQKVYDLSCSKYNTTTKY